jgi:hypothetical protein
LIDGLASILREDQIDHILRARQAADMGRENAVRAQLHLQSFSLSSCLGFARRF